MPEPSRFASCEINALPDSSTTPTVVLPSYTEALHADATNLYFNDFTATFSSMPKSGGTAQPLGLATRPFDLNGDSIYGLESADGGSILTKAAKVNGSWLRTRALGSGYGTRIVFVGDRYFVEFGSSGHLSAKLDANAPIVQFLEPGREFAKTWVGSADKFYWTDGRRIFSRPIPTP